MKLLEYADTSEEELFCEEEIFFFCDHCNFKTRKEKGIKVHIGRVHSLKCEICDEKFISVENLERQMKNKTLVDNLGETRIVDGLEVSKYRNDELVLLSSLTQKLERMGSLLCTSIVRSVGIDLATLAQIFHQMPVGI